MTSRNSFWASSKENHKRRIWVWIVAALVQLISYVGILTVYLSRIRMWNAEGAYQTAEAYQNALYQATKDALGFQDNLLFVLAGLAVMIGLQGYSYLYDRRKVDMYHSVPVNKNRRFCVIYVNGMIIYLVTALSSLLISVISAAAQKAVNGEVMAVVGLGFLWNFLLFLVLYHTVILAVMLTGNRFITLCAIGTFAFYEMMVYILFNAMQSAFFKTTDRFYISYDPKFSVLSDYVSHIREIKYQVGLKEMAWEVLPFYGKWFLLAAVLLAAAWLCYRRRPSEAAGKAMAFPVIEPVVKALVVIPLAIGMGMWVFNAGYGNVTIAAVTMIAGGIVCSAAMEVVYDFDLKSLLKHPVSSIVSVLGIVVIFYIFKCDVFGYDKYVPKQDKLESIALLLDFYPDFWDEEFKYVWSGDRTRESMHIVNTEPVLALAAKAQQEDIEDMEDPRAMHVLYRLKSGREVGRLFYVDFANPVNEELLNQIVGTKEYREGIYQILTDQVSFGKVLAMSYSNGAAEVALPAEDGWKLQEAYSKDLEQFDFTLARKNRPCGEIRIKFPNWMDYTLSVYDSFEHTIAYLASREAYFPVQLNPEDIDSITVTNYHNELSESGKDVIIYDSETVAADYTYMENSTVTETFYEQEEFEKILPVIYPNYITSVWHDEDEVDNNYSVYITFKKDTAYPYDRSSYGFNYLFYTGQVPAFVEEATALDDAL